MNQNYIDNLLEEDWVMKLSEEDRGKVVDSYKNAKSFEKKLNVLSKWHPRGCLTLKPIKTLDEYFKYIRYAANDSTWFRGDSKDFGHLIPKLYRNISEDNVEDQHEKERSYYLEFRRRARSLVPSIEPDDVWSWYFLIQHYGGPTRLLDWTQDAAIALFFALDKDRDSTENPIVTLLQANVLTDYAFKDIEEARSFSGTVLYPGELPTERWITNIAGERKPSIELIPNFPIALLPPHSDPRISAQSSCFTLFGKLIHGFLNKEKDIVCPCCDQKVIFRLDIDGHKKNELRKELSRIGIASGKVYPGLEGLCREISEELF